AKTFQALDYKPPMLIADNAGFSDPSTLKTVGKQIQGIFNRSSFAIGPAGSPTYLINEMYKKKSGGDDMDDTVARQMQGFFVLVGGLLLGAVYALFSSGLTLIWGMMNIVNFAHGDFVMLGMYVAFVVWTLLGVGPFVGAPMAALVLATLGIIVYFGLIRSVMK